MRWHKKLKVLRCYLFIIGWLGVLLLCLSYWKIDADGTHSPGSLPRKNTHESTLLSEDKPRYKKPRVQCNSPDRIRIGHEGEVPKEYQLNGVVIIFRHGDRGPLTEVKNLSSINCGYKGYGTKMYKRFVADIMNASKTNTYINFVGPFMKYPILPPPSRCSIGHLTPLGATQHLHLGKILRSVYIDKLKLLTQPWELDDILAFSSKFRRTFQSLLAFIHAFIPVFDLSNIRLRESKGVNFCDIYCKCDRALIYDQKHDQEKRSYMNSHPSVGELLAELSHIVKVSNSETEITSPQVMRDALLAYACHGAKFPCDEKRCVTFDDLAKIISYEEWEAKQKRNSNQMRSAKLKMYGLLKSISSNLEGMMSNNKPKIAIYSGHDLTINLLLSSLDISHFQAPYYGARVIIELYHNTSAPSAGVDYRNNYYFRIIYNGKDITKLLSFCVVKVVKKIDSGIGGKVSNMTLCSIVSLQNYLNINSFFKEFNATSFTSACVK